MDDYTKRVIASQLQDTEKQAVDEATELKSLRLRQGGSRAAALKDVAQQIRHQLQADVSVDATLAQRGARYGDFTDHAAIAQSRQDTMRAAPGWGRLDAVKRQALTVIADKIARVLSGDPEYADNWHDIQGYAKLVEDRLTDARPC